MKYKILDGYISSSDPNDQYVVNMVNWINQGKGNVFSYLLTLPIDVLEEYSKYAEDEESISAPAKDQLTKLGIMAVYLEKGIEIGAYTATIDELIQNLTAVSTACALALFHKIGMNKVTDESKIWESNGEKIQIEMCDEMFEIIQNNDKETAMMKMGILYNRLLDQYKEKEGERDKKSSEKRT